MYDLLRKCAYSLNCQYRGSTLKSGLIFIKENISPDGMYIMGNDFSLYRSKTHFQMAFDIAGL